MPDMLVHLLKLPPVDGLASDLREQGVVIRRANSFEATAVRKFVEAHFGTGWADEILPCFAHHPVTLFLAIREGKVIGFGAYEATRRGFFGPTGVLEAERGKQIGRALLLACLWGLYDMGYAYGIIGGAGPVPFYEKAVNAKVISDSVPGIYTDMLKGD
jgi:hypothetical protein